MRFLPFLSSRHTGEAIDPRAEQRLVAEAVLRTAASLVNADAGGARGVLEQQCQALTVLAPRIVLAWTWFGAAHTTTIRPQVMAGSAADYARSLTIQRNLLTELGPAFRTLSGKRIEPCNVSPLSPFGPWRSAAVQHDVKTVLALPLASSVNEERGLFVLYSDTENYFEEVGVSLFEALAHLFSAVLSSSARQAELKQAANCDPLTGLANRNAVHLLDASVRRVIETDLPCAVLIIDIDHFKAINDSHGHAAGDIVLCGVARQLQAALRQGDTVARWGGEEFVVCLPGAGIDTAVAVAEKLRRTLAQSAFPLASGRSPSLTVSIGIAPLQLAEPLVSAIERADVALYAAKQRGRNRVEVAVEADLPSIGAGGPSGLAPNLNSEAIAA
ncbi:MAG: GGDEF domain-containing protein [Caldimonas sp.]